MVKSLTIMESERASETAPPPPPTSFEPTTLSERRFSLESFNRIYNIAIIGCTINLTSDLYGKVKVSNATANFLLHSAEQSVQAAVSLAEPVLITLQKPLKATDSLICNTMDKFVECNAKAKETQRKVTKVIANLPVQSAINCAKAVSSYSAEKVGHFVTQIKHQQQNKDEEEQCGDETTLREGKPRKQDNSTQTGMTESGAGSVRDKIEYFSKML